jgi:hypothetical protein
MKTRPFTSRAKPVALSTFFLLLSLGCDTTSESDPAVPAPSSSIQITPHEGKPLPEVAGGDVGHLQDLERGLQSISDATTQAVFDEAFRLTFSKDKTLRSYGEAKVLFDTVLKTMKTHPQTLRGLGYIAVNQGMQLGRAMAFYRAAIKADKNYGDAHYGLAFLYGTMEPAKGIGHYRQAMALGIKDTRNLKGKFYGKWLATKPKTTLKPGASSSETPLNPLPSSEIPTPVGKEKDSP